MSIFRFQSLAAKYKQDAPKCQVPAPFSSQDEEPGRGIPTPVLVGAGLLLAGASCLAGTMAYAWLATHPPRFPVVKIDKHDDPKWEDITFPARDGLRIAGWFAPAKAAQGGVILCHGHPMNRVGDAALGASAAPRGLSRPSVRFSSDGRE